jgi:hypothetical protein
MPGEKMAKTATKTLVAATLLSFVALPALSRDNHREGDNDRGQIYHGAHDKAPEIENYHGRHEVSAPEIDPGQVVGALALLSGTVAIISRYRRKK